MREIKFRAWNDDTKRMNGIGQKNLGGGRSLDLAVGETRLMQYTGLKDKNGVEIYEGDIVEVDWNDARYPKHNVEVEWDDENLSWQIEGGCLTTDNHHFEVIGNIYENPELLK